jgi:hypothetical protein
VASKTPEQLAVLRWRKGHAAAAQRQLELSAAEGAKRGQAVKEAISAFQVVSVRFGNVDRDAVSELGVQEVRRRWARIQRRAKEARK